MHSLVIIDMQEQFCGAKRPHLENPILREIALAKAHNYPIVIIEFKYFGNTQNYIWQAIGNYKNVLSLVKDRISGANEINQTLPNITKTKRIRVCGIYTDCCVYHTVIDLISLGWKAEVVADACYSNDDDHKWGINSLKYNGVKILRSAQIV
jgi:nicotinamidase-related amidase